MEIIAQHGSILLFIAAAVAFFMAFGIGANDVANAMGTSVGSKALTIKQALFIAMIFEFAGAYLAGGEVTATIRNGIIDADAFKDAPHLLVFGMIAALMAAGVWLIVATHYGWPVSTTHTIVGAIAGFGVVSVGSDAVAWDSFGEIVGSWFVTPVVAGFISYGLFMSVQKLIFDTDNPFEKAKRYVPFYMFLTALTMSLVTIKKGLKHVGLEITNMEGNLISVGVAIAFAVVGAILIRRIKYEASDDIKMHYVNVEKVFAVLMIFTACGMAFAHGSNDVANAIGPLSAIVAAVQFGDISDKAPIIWWVLPLGAVGIVAGLAILGEKVISTIGSGITHLTPSRGFAAEMAAAATVVLASGTGMPISTTQTLVGAVLGVGMARGIAALNMNMMGKIFTSWIVTLPAGALLAIGFYEILVMLFA